MPTPIPRTAMISASIKIFNDARVEIPTISLTWLCKRQKYHRQSFFFLWDASSPKIDMVTYY